MKIVPILKGINSGAAMDLMLLRNEARGQRTRQFAGWYRMYRLFIEPSGEFSLEVPDDITSVELNELTPPS